MPTPCGRASKAEFAAAIATAAQTCQIVHVVKYFNVCCANCIEGKSMLCIIDTELDTMNDVKMAHGLSLQCAYSMLRSIPQDAFHLDPLANRVKKCDKDTISDDVKMFASKLSGVLNILGQVQDTGTVIGL
eukprot:618376-Prymnesium_polylepis.1